MSSNTSAGRNIFPFGNSNQTASRKMADYQIDCKMFPNRDALASAIKNQWQDKGLVVLLNTGMQHLSELEDWGKIFFKDFVAYEGGSAPRDKWGETVFSIDDTPSHVDMCYHNEMCYLPIFPRCFVIGSLQCPSKGGETWVSDNVVTTDELLATPIGQALKDKHVRYIRNMTDKYAGERIVYKHWQDTFFTDSQAEVEKYLENQGWDYQWLDNGTLRTSYCVNAYEYHESLEKNLFFASLVSHAAFFDQWSPFNTLADEERPFTMTLGDGTPFSNDEIEQIYACYNRTSLAVAWQYADVAILDNERWTHARPAFTLLEGERRIMGVTMGMMKNRLGSRF